MPTTDPYFDSVSLLLHADVDGAVPTDVKGNTVTGVGSAQASAAQSKFGGASAHFDGSGSYLSVPYAAALDLSFGDFTIEMWVMPTATPNGGALITSPYPNYVKYTLAFASSIGAAGGSNLFFGFYNGDWYGVMTTPLTNDVWTHVAAVKHGSTYALFVNGVLAGASNITSPMPTDSQAIWIGRRWDTSGPSSYFAGYIDDVRITKGVARYSSNFSVPTEAYPDIAGDPPPPPPITSTLLLEFEGDTVVDSSPNNLTPETSTLTLSTAQAKFGTQSAHGGGYVRFVDPVLLIGFLPFTVHFWAYPASNSGEHFYFDSRESGGSQRGFTVITRSGCLGFSDGGVMVGTDAPTQMALDTWQHVEVCRTSDGNAFIFLNGVKVASGVANTWTNFFASTHHIIGAGQYFPPGVEPFLGYMDEFQMVIGTAIHTDTFTPPTGPYGDSGGGSTTLQTVASSAGSAVASAVGQSIVIVTGASRCVLQVLHELRIVFVPVDCDAMRVPLDACATMNVPVDYTVMALACEPPGVAFALPLGSTFSLHSKTKPWDVSINPSFEYVYGGGLDPELIPANEGRSILITVTGSIEYFSGSIPVPPEGVAREPANPVLPSNFVPGRSTSTPDFTGVVGAWCDDAGHVLLPVWIGAGGFFAPPHGATRLQVGINDWLLGDNVGSFTVVWRS